MKGIPYGQDETDERISEAVSGGTHARKGCKDGYGTGG